MAALEIGIEIIGGTISPANIARKNISRRALVVRDSWRRKSDNEVP